MKCYAILELDFLRGKIIRRNVCTAVAYRALKVQTHLVSQILKCLSQERQDVLWQSTGLGQDRRI